MTPIVTQDYIAVREKRLVSYEVGNIFGGEISVAPSGSFRNDDDNRPSLTKESFNPVTNTNTSYTFTYSDLQCKSCPSSHPILGRGVRPCFVLTDQHFPATVPVNGNGKCLAIIRIEDCSLNELTELFLARIRTEWLPMGTVILMSAPGYLSGIGIVDYAEEFTCNAIKIQDRLKNSGHVIHAPPILLAGCEDPALIRALAELGHWLMAMAAYDNVSSIPDTTETWLDMVCRLGDAPTQNNYGIRLSCQETPTAPGNVSGTANHRPRCPHIFPLSRARTSERLSKN